MRCFRGRLESLFVGTIWLLHRPLLLPGRERETSVRGQNVGEREWKRGQRELEAWASG